MSPHEFDAELRQALAGEAPAEQAARLADFWRRKSRAERRRRRVRMAAAMAAATAGIATGAVWWSAHPARDGKDIATVPANQGKEFIAEAVRKPATDAKSAGRAPTAYERVMFAARARRPVAAERVVTVADVRLAIEELVADPTADAESAASRHALTRPAAEPLLLRELRRAGDDRRLAVVRLLGVCGTIRSIAPLTAAAGDEFLRTAAIESVEQVGGVEHLATGIRHARHVDVRAALLKRQLGIDSDASLRSFLSLVADNALRSEALAAAVAAERLPVAALVGLLDDDDKSVRLSAALVLGRVDGPQIANALIDRLQRDGRAPVEAWVALMACRDDSTTQFLAAATREPRLLGQVNNARMFWARFTP